MTKRKKVAAKKPAAKKAAAKKATKRATPGPAAVEAMPDDGDDESDDDDGGEGERCPFCRRVNEPGAEDTCKHWVCTIHDGQVIWGDLASAFEDAYNEARRPIEALDGDDALDQLVRRMAKGPDARAFKAILAEDKLWWLSEARVISEETNTLLMSGTGHSVYHDDPKWFAGIIASIVRVGEAIAELTSDEEDPGSPMKLPARVQRWVDVVVDTVWRDGRDDDSPEYERLCKWLETEWERISSGSGSGVVAYDTSNDKGTLTDTEVRDQLGLEEDDEVSMDDRRAFLIWWGDTKLEDADVSEGFATLELTDRNGRTALLGYSVSGFSFTEVRTKFSAAYRDEDAFLEDVLGKDWITGEGDITAASDAWVMAFFEKPRASRRQKSKER